ncbi:MAG: hypothetical protein NC926_11135 [Candidatus Omnitrophica bacterium]|nr:hypothetical protein [Candidatus Omnitrophota bacterium]
MFNEKIFSKNELIGLLEYLTEKNLLGTERKSRFFGSWDGENGFVVLNPEILSLIKQKFKAIDLSIIRVKFPNKVFLVVKGKREEIEIDEIF